MDAFAFIGEHDSEFFSGLPGHRNCCDREVRTGLDVLAEHLAVVHPVELVAAQDDIIIIRVLQEVSHVLPHGIGGSLVPHRPLRRLLRGENFDKARSEVVELIAGINVSVKRRAIELGEDVDPSQAGIEAVADWDIDQSVFSCKGDSWFGSLFCEGKETRSCTSSHDDCQCFRSRKGTSRLIHKQFASCTLLRNLSRYKDLCVELSDMLDMRKRYLC